MIRIVLFASLVASTACHNRPAASEKTVTPVRVATVNLYQPKNGSRYSATIMPGRQVSLAFRVSGLVANIHRVGNRGLDPGDIVPGGGTVLARLRQEDYHATLAQAQSQLDSAKQSQQSAAAQLTQAEASRSKAEADFKRAQALMSSQSLTRPEFDSARTQLDVTSAQVAAGRAQLDAAAAQIRNAEANVATARLAQEDSALVSPFTASVTQRNVEVGMLAGPSLTAYSLVDIGTVKATFGVPDTVVVQTRPGRTIAISVEALPGREFRGAVSSIASVADSETRLFQVEVTLPNHEMLLKPGMIASLSLDNAMQMAALPVVPLSAVVRDNTNPAGFAVMVVEGNVAKARRVGLGATYGELLAISSGLRPGEHVIRSGGTLVNDGDAVEVMP